MEPIVIIEKLEDDALLNQFRGSIEALSLADSFNRATAVFIKPNLTYPVYKKGVTTRKEFVERLVAALREINEKTLIYIGEGEGGYNSFSMSEALDNMGFFEIERRFPNVKVINLSEMSAKEIEIDTPKGPYKMKLPELFFNEIDFSISCPLPKVHCMTRLTLSYKNQWGCLPDMMRLKNHYMFDHVISKVSNILKFKYAFLDGKFGLNVNGPMVGEPVEVGWFAASNSLGAFDMVVSEMMGFDWRHVGHLKMAKQYGFIPDREDVTIIGEIDKLKRNFHLKRDFWNYPALVAFHSRALTDLVYLSKWAKLIHDIMYTFRKRAIDEDAQ